MGKSESTLKKKKPKRLHLWKELALKLTAVVNGSSNCSLAGDRTGSNAKIFESTIPHHEIVKLL